MDKCDGCLTCGRTPEDEPYCVASCPTKALHFGPIEEMEALAAEGGGVGSEAADHAVHRLTATAPCGRAAQRLRFAYAP